MFEDGLNRVRGKSIGNSNSLKAYGLCHTYLNAEMLNAMGGYSEDPYIFYADLYNYAEEGLLTLAVSYYGPLSRRVLPGLLSCTTRWSNP